MLVNVDAKMPRKMFEALSILEAICAVSDQGNVDVRQWLKDRYGEKLAEQFRPEFFKIQAAGEDQK